MRTVKAVLPATLAAGAIIALGGCGQTVPGQAQPATQQNVPATTTSTPPQPARPTTKPRQTKTVYVQPPTTKTVVVQGAPADTPASDQWYAQSSWIDAQPWITITPDSGQTDCQWLHINGYSYAEAYAAWAQRGYPSNWSATGDGYPCQKSYGMQH